jgi:hypothetical protein
MTRDVAKTRITPQLVVEFALVAMITDVPPLTI